MPYAAFLLAAVSVAPAPPPPSSVGGTVAYRERVALPDDAQLVLQVSRYGGEGQRLVTEVTMRLAGAQVPVRFTVPVSRPAAQGAELGIVARIVAGGVPMFESPRAEMFDLAKEPDLRLMLVRSQPAAASLEGRTWRLVSLEGATIPQEGERPTLSFEAGGKIAGFGGVNRFSGSYEGKDGHIQIDPGAMTMMAGPEGWMAVEAALLRALPLANRAAVFEGRLQLMRGERLLAQFEPAG